MQTGFSVLTEYMSLGQFGKDGYPQRWFELDGKIDSLTGIYKCDLPVGDTGVVFIGGMKADTVVFGEFQYLVGSENDWKHFQITIDGGAQVDSIFVGIGFNVEYFYYDGTTANGWLQVDDFKVYDGATVNSAIPNGGFESWVPRVNENPVGWTTTDAFSVSSTMDFVTKTNDANSGNSAVQMQWGDWPTWHEEMLASAGIVYGDL